MIDKATAQSLNYGQTLEHVSAKQNGGKSPLRVRVTGKCLAWKTRPDEFRIPVKHGLYESGYITHENGQFWVVA